jgi:plastocyanin
MAISRLGQLSRAGLCCFLGALAIVSTGLLGSGCPSSALPPPQAGVTDVTIRNLAFSPKAVTIKKGESVRWTNRDSVVHTATSGNPGDADAGSAFNTADIAPGTSSAAIQFNDTGDFVYFCQHHPTIMFGAKITVTD